MSTVYDFKERLAFSGGVRKESDIDTIKSLVVGCVKVEKTSVAIDKTGVDYIATLRGGATINIDAKTRDVGCSKFWRRGEPELSLEIWSVRPGGKYNIPRDKAKTGWTLNESSPVDYIYCTFFLDDTDRVYMLPFQLYRMAFHKNFVAWCGIYKHGIQDSGTWDSECIFVPVYVVLEAIGKEMEIKLSRCVA
jgi:hypothetical protein